MKAMRKFYLLAATLFVMVACTSGNKQKDGNMDTPSHVEIRQHNGAHNVYINNISLCTGGSGVFLRSGSRAIRCRDGEGGDGAHSNRDI